jgi:hypothetical protein
MFRAKCEADQDLGNRRRLHSVALRSYNPDGSMQGLAAANAKSATPFTTAGRVEQVGTGGAVIAIIFSPAKAMCRC